MSEGKIMGIQKLKPVTRNWFRIGDFAETTTGKIVRILSLDYEFVVTDEGYIKKKFIKHILE